MSRPSSVNQTRTILLAADDKNSVINELAGAQPIPRAYTVYGWQPAAQANTHTGFNGELCERIFGWYFLGNGYRVYNPVLMLFHSPDSWSPFGKGGRNGYAYCGRDPRNFTDPTGHMLSGLKLFGKTRKTLSTASSTSSLTPLIANTPQASPTAKSMTAMISDISAGTTNPNFIDTGPNPVYENIPIITGMTPRKEIPYQPLPPRYGNEIPPPIPLKRMPRFNDSGGQVGIISPNWKPDEPRRYRIAWESKPFLFPRTPVPPTRALKSGGTREYYMRYDNAGNPKQSSVQKMTMQQIRNLTR